MIRDPRSRHDPAHRLRLLVAVAACALLTALAPAAPAFPQDDPHAAHRAMIEPPAELPDAGPVAELEIPDVEVLTQEGERVHFYRDLVEGKTVAMNFVFTTCTTICPPMGAIFGRLQDELGDRLGDEVHLVSVSVDPATDTPERLAAWAANFDARDGWTLVTGDTATIERLLKALGVFTADVADHAPVALIGHDPSGTWTRAYGLAGPDDVAAILDEVAHGAQHAPAAEGGAR